MTLPGYQRLTIGLAILSILLFAMSLGLFLESAQLTMRVAFASEQTEIFEQMRDQALQSEPSQAAACLQYAVGYYPSGTKQVTGSRLDRIVERDRACAIRAIVNHLRSKTGRDLGDEPQNWIDDLVDH